MKILKFLLGILLISFIICQDRRTKFAQNIENYAKNITLPNGTEELVTGFDNKLVLLFYTLTLEELNEVQSKFGLSDFLTNQIKYAPYARTSGGIKVEEKIQYNFYSYEETLGSAIKEEDNKVTFALIKTQSFAQLRARYEKYYVEKCKRTWIVRKKCHKEERQREKVLTNDEKLLVTNAAKFSARKSILEGTEILKKGDYELYMTDTQSIFSPDHKSVVHLTYFGNIAIGPTSELNAILPIKYEYEEDSNGHLTKLPAGNYTKQIKYPINESDTQGGDLIVNKGLFHKFNFLVKSELTKFPRQYINYMDELSKKGPFIFEIKKNGNVILYEKKTKNIIWQTNTANQGKGPYHLHLTNDKILILEDSNGKILYQSGEYKNIPTILSSNSTKNGPHIYNGIILNPIYYVKYRFVYVFRFKGEVIVPIKINQLHIMTDNDEKYTITYGGRIRGKDKWFNYNNKGNYHPELYNEQMEFDMFNATLTGDYDICYTAYLIKKGWTSIACNGDIVGIDSNIKNKGLKFPFLRNLKSKKKIQVNNYYITSLVIYVKEKGESIPSISKNPAIVYY